MSDLVEVLWAWTPFLLGGFGWNVAISVLATLIGTLLGGVLAMLQFSSLRPVQHVVGALVSFCRNVPSLVFLFYMATLIPHQLSFGDIVVHVPDWLKAAIALSASPIGFTALNLHASVRHWRDGRPRAALLFIPNWLGGFLITLLASSTASLVGVSELVGRCNTVITATGTTYLFPIYVYALCIFFAFCYPVSLALGWLRQALVRRFSQPEA